MQQLIDWAGLMRVGMGPPGGGGLGLTPERFWALTPLELRVMLGRLDGGDSVMRRADMEALMAAWPDVRGSVVPEEGERDG